MSKQHGNMTKEQAITWVEKNCSFSDVRNRMASRAACWVIYKMLEEAVLYIAQLEQLNNVLKERLNYNEKEIN